MSSPGKKEPSGGVKFLVVMLYVIGVVLQGGIIYFYLSGGRDIFAASFEGDTEAVKSAVESGADVNAKDKDGKTALMYASERGFEDIVRYLLNQKGIDINARDSGGKTALIYATEKGRAEIVKLLKTAGAKE